MKTKPVLFLGAIIVGIVAAHSIRAQTAPATAPATATAPAAVVDEATRAKIAAANQDMGAFKMGLAAFFITTGRYPTTAEGLDALVKRPAGASGNPNDWPMVKKLGDDPWGNAYIYRCPPTNGADYDLLSAGPDGKEGTEDDIVNWQK